MLEEKTNSKLAGTVCDLLCDFEGIKEFINLIEKYEHLVKKIEFSFICSFPTVSVVFSIVVHITRIQS